MATKYHVQRHNAMSSYSWPYPQAPPFSNIGRGLGTSSLDSFSIGISYPYVGIAKYMSLELLEDSNVAVWSNLNN